MRHRAFAICLLIACLQALAAATWSPTGATTVPGVDDRGATLSDGRVLVVHQGGEAELYAPWSGVWVRAGRTVVRRSAFTLTALPSGGAVVAGGFDGEGNVGTYEVFAPSTRTWSIRGTLRTARSNHIAESLPGGRVLIAGGIRDLGPSEDLPASFLASAEIIDPTAGSALPAGSMSTVRSPASSARLADGKILVVGGYAGSSGSLQAGGDVYDPLTGRWTPTANEMEAPIEGFAITPLFDGRALITGGYIPYASSVIPRNHVYQPRTRTFVPAPALMEPRANHTATLLADGRVLIAGGHAPDDFADQTARAELYYPTLNRFVPTRAMGTPRSRHAARKMFTNAVLVTGGEWTGGSSEVFRPGTWLGDLHEGLRLARPAPIAIAANG
jgi:hypothetical protein